MEAILKFSLPEEESEHRLALAGSSAHDVLWRFDQHLRNRIKHEELPEKVMEELEELRNLLHIWCDERRVFLDD